MTARQNALTHQNRVSPQGSGVGALGATALHGFSAVSPAVVKICVGEIARYVLHSRVAHM